MIDLIESAKLNNMIPEELTQYFLKYPGSGLEVIGICERCGRTKNQRFQNVSRYCHKCAGNDIIFKEKQSKNTKKTWKDQPEKFDTEKRKEGYEKASISMKETRSNNPELWDTEKRKEGYEKASISMKGKNVGEKNGNWKGGLKLTDYKKYIIRKIYNDECSICHEKQKGKDTILTHHIDGDNTNNKFSNLVTLCKSCHRYIHMDMEYYKMALSLNKNINIKELI